MIKVAHRVNTISELRAIPRGFGVEVDIRNRGNELILSHGPFSGGDSFDEYCNDYSHSLLVLNVKTEGIEDEALRIVKKHGIEDYFFLDITFPTILKLSAQGEKNIAVRFSEYEPVENALALRDKVKWVWVDTFTKHPLTKSSYAKIRKAGFKVFLVGPDRWGRPDEIGAYKTYLKKNGMAIDAVMSSSELLERWD